MSALTLADAKTHLNVTGTAQDVELQTVIDAAEAAIASVVGPLEPTAITTRIRPTAYPGLVLPVLPAYALTSITPRGGSALTLGTVQLDQAAGLVTYEAPGGGSWSATYYDVVYQAGRNPVPKDLLLAVKEMVRHIWETQRGPGTGGRPGSSQALANTLPGAAYALPIRVSQLLAPHAQPGFA